MKISKQQWFMLATGVALLALVYWFFFRKKKTESSYDENVMIFGNENGYTNYELDGGSLESGYKKDCPKGQVEDICEKKEIRGSGDNEQLVITRYRCCVPGNIMDRKANSKKVMRSAGGGSQCKDSKGNIIPCAPIKVEDVIEVRTIG